MILRVVTHPAYDYILLGATNLNPPVTWSPMLTNSGTGGIITNTVPVSSSPPQKFFRYQVQ